MTRQALTPEIRSRVVLHGDRTQHPSLEIHFNRFDDGDSTVEREVERVGATGGPYTNAGTRCERAADGGDRAEDAAPVQALELPWLQTFHPFQETPRTRIRASNSFLLLVGEREDAQR